MLSKAGSLKVVAVFFILGALVYPQVAQADWDRDHDRRLHHEKVWHYPAFGTISLGLPHGFISLSLGRSRYYYYDGVYYRKTWRGYVVVEAPIGAVIGVAPSYYQTVVINGRTYFVSDGVYYQQIPTGYMIVNRPTEVLVSTPQTVIQQPVVNNSAVVNGDGFTVNIPNASGSYTSVIIKRSGNGFVGPQGEFYNQFPTVEQLRVMYGK